jgi:hypothetical protein
MDKIYLEKTADLRSGSTIAEEGNVKGKGDNCENRRKI